jgi:glucan 1,3-beta-glucosidase
MGGYFVLEPWITPSLFYQFLDKEKGKVAFDSYSFCQVLGKDEGNR